MSLLKDRRYEVFGVLALGFLLALVLLVSAFLSRAFVNVVSVTATVPAGSAPLLKGAEVKLYGAPVGRVTDARIKGNDNVISIDLDASQAKKIPVGVKARVLPSTLFGLEFVDLAPPAGTSASSAVGLSKGTFIAPDLSVASVETTKLLADVYPILNSLDPAQINATLTALATALDGRGEQLGKTVEQLDTYVKGIAPEVPTLIEDVRALATLSGTLNASAPDLLDVVRNTVKTGRTLADERSTIMTLVGATEASTTRVKDVLDTNEPDLVQLTRRLQVTLDALVAARGDLARGVRALPPALSALQRVLSVHPALNVVVRLPAPSRCRYTAGERPTYLSDLDAPQSTTLDPQTCAATGGAAAAVTPQEKAAAQVTTTLSSNPLEKQAIAEIMAPVLDVPEAQVPDVATLLLGPILRSGLLGPVG